MIGIVDMEMGNLRSVSNAIYSLGFDFTILRDAAGFGDVSHVIIPGVGSYTTAMGQLHKLRLVTALRDFAATGRPLMGICLGMQLLSDRGDEGGDSPGLGLIPGRVSKIPDDPVRRVPHIGWNNLEVKAPDHPVFEKIRSGVDFYFVHSYEFSADAADTYAVTDYGRPLVAIVGRRNVIGFQFHPEKSQANGLRLLENFCNWEGAC